MDVSEILGATLGALISLFIVLIILSAVVHFVLGDNILLVFILYILMAIMAGAILSSAATTKSTAIVGVILTIIIAFSMLNFGFTRIFGPDIGFPYSMLNLGSIYTGLIISLFVGLIFVFRRN